MGNRLSKSEDGQVVQTCAYGAANLLESVNGTSYTYDDNGNTLYDGAFIPSLEEPALSPPQLQRRGAFLFNGEEMYLLAAALATWAF